MTNNIISKLHSDLNELAERQKSLSETVRQLETSDLSQENARLSDKVYQLTNTVSFLESRLTDANTHISNLEADLRRNTASSRPNIPVIPISPNIPIQNQVPINSVPIPINAPANNAPIHSNAPVNSVPIPINAPANNAPIHRNAPVNSVPIPINAPANNVPIHRNAPVNNVSPQYNAMTNNAPIHQNSAPSPHKENSTKGFEKFLGLHLMSGLGVLLILFGIIAGAKYVYINMAAGAALLVAGEVLNRKWRGVFSLTVTAGGLAMLFLSTSLGYFNFGKFGFPVMFMLCILFSIIGFLLSRRYQSQVIALFALVGGYLPLISNSLSSFDDKEIGNIIALCVYVTLLNVFALSFSARRQWLTLRFFGIFAGIIADLFLVMGCWHTSTVNLAIASITISYLSYQLIPVLGSRLTATLIKPSDIGIMSFNILIRYLFIQAMFTEFYSDFSAIVPLLFAVSCIIMAFIVERNPLLGQNKAARALFFITSVSFGALVVPIWLDAVWISLGWLVEGVGLMLYGLYKEKKRFTVAGGIIGSLCVITFLSNNAFIYEEIFVWRYLALTVGTLSITAMLAYKNKSTHAGWQAFICCSLLNLSGFVAYLLFSKLANAIAHSPLSSEGRAYTVFLFIIFCIVYASVLPRIKRLYSASVRAVSIILGIIAVITTLLSNFLFYSFTPLSDMDVVWRIIAVILFLTANVLSVLFGFGLLRLMKSHKLIPPHLYHIFLSAFAVMVLCQNLHFQLRLRDNSPIITIIFTLTGLAWIVFGLFKYNKSMRICGLFTSILTVLKLFITDFDIADNEARILSYFAMGVLLLAMSFAYQYFTKKFDAVKADNENLN